MTLSMSDVAAVEVGGGEAGLCYCMLYHIVTTTVNKAMSLAVSQTAFLPKPGFKNPNLQVNV